MANLPGLLVKQFIRNVRAAKTIADERAVIQKESAAIRASFREESHDHGTRYVSSLDSCMHDHLEQLLMSFQTEQCSQAALPVYPG